MNAARKERHPRPHRDDDPPGRPGWLTAIAVALLTARLLLPTEASVDGETLWQVQLWILAIVVWAWRYALSGRRLIHFDLGTLAAGLLVAGHLVSGIVLFVEGGDKRAAVNMMWEWVSLGITFVIVRSLLAERESRRTVIAALTCVCVALAGLGLNQHFIQFPRLADEYREKRVEFDKLQASLHSGTAAQRSLKAARAQELHRWFVQREIPLEGAGRKQWEARILSSTEPFGTFGLTNSFAGLLLVFLFPAGAMALVAIRRHGSDRRWVEIAVVVLMVALIAACLLLTKSRTAWVGGLIGAGVWWWMSRSGRSAVRNVVGWGVAGLVVAAGIVVTAALTGGLDREVISESPKSLRYRWQYWTGTAGVLAERPLFGPGPGNFRQQYVKHKLPEASEEIRDPHNLILDAWCSGGLIALAGLLLLFVWCVRAHWRCEWPASPPDRGRAGNDESPAGTIGIVGGFVTVIFAVWFLDEADPLRLWALLAGGLGTWLLIRKLRNEIEFSPACLAAALAALCVHLLGAGGMEMPAITQLLLLLSAAVAVEPFAQEGEVPRAAAASSPRIAVALAVTAAAAVVFGTCMSTATIRVITRKSASDKGRSLWLARHGRMRDAERLLAAAAENDPLSPAPARELAEFVFRQWEQAQQRKELLEGAIKLQQVAVRLDPHHYKCYWTLGEWYRRKHEIGRAPDDLRASLAAYEEAVDRYPHNAALLADYSRILTQAERHTEAQEVARSALDQDALNRREGHTDKLLPAEIRQRLLNLTRKTEKTPRTSRRN